MGASGEAAVSIKEALLPEFDHEMGTTRKLLERVPHDDLTWRPHRKSMTIGQLAWHLADIPHWADAILDCPSFDLAVTEGAGSSGPKQPSSGQEVLERFDAFVTSARAKIAAKTDAEMLALWSLKRGGREMFSVPRIGAIRSFIVNHTIHHRGQLSVYLRLKDVPVPAIYGPSADEGR
jgi:uncharacterized damage-inducible protein DinB